MIIFWSPQRSNTDISYQFNGDVITVTLDGELDVFDFTNMPDGEASEITSSLDICPILSAKRVSGVLHVTLLRAIPHRPRQEDYEEEKDFLDALDDWKSLWTDNLEEVIE